MITGILMGDGYIHQSKKNPQLQVEMISPNYLQYVANKFGILGGKVNLYQTASEGAQRNRKTGFRPNADKVNYSDVYRWYSMAHPELKKFSKWYSTGKKVWPKDIELTPTVLKHWYCGDGHWRNYKNTNHIVISMSNESEEKEKVSQIFESVGLPSPNNYEIQKRKDGSETCNAAFTVDQSKELWEYMGDPLPDFEYKWPEEYH
jgi:hypothetical protein